MPQQSGRALRVLLVAVPETAGSALYGLLDVLSAAGGLWQTLLREQPRPAVLRPGIVATSLEPFACGNDIPVRPSASVRDDPVADLIIVPEVWLEPDASLTGRHPEIVDWLRRSHRRGAHLYSACSGAILLAETGLLDGCDATSHWGYADLFRQQYPRIRFRPEPSLAFADPAGRVVTAGGTTSWHDLALHIIARHISPAEALRIAKVYLLKWHDEGQLPYTPLVRHSPHGDAVIRRVEDFLQAHHAEPEVLATAVRDAGIPVRTLKRRFRAATGSSLTGRLQDLRVERAKELLEQSSMAVDAISAAVGYEDASFFRQLFRRRTGVAPRDYRRMFRPPAADTPRSDSGPAAA
ncbi:helix-turn-helix domain-containing protein [Methylonatrum kenyense]|uniref:GlxA family transcriptional regulator n=1 Tax=Methylonatrum kenyense TaxID=455253 RepID=UPI0020BE3934|nr:helix-turn-helix domain-containing protein [Methylonatrum kenyense]MCK8515014.1 helix-turn-helix domain-containing protein [Methylonatrum kenyense]